MLFFVRLEFVEYALYVDKVSMKQRTRRAQQQQQYE